VTVSLNEFYFDEASVVKIKMNKYGCIKANASFMRFAPKNSETSRFRFRSAFRIFSKTYISNVDRIFSDILGDVAVDFRSMLSGRTMKAQTLSKSSEASQESSNSTRKRFPDDSFKDLSI